MKRMSKNNLNHIKIMFEEKSGVKLEGKFKGANHEGIIELVSKKRTKIIWAASLALCFLVFGAFGFVKFSGLNGDEARFVSAYQGEGVVKLMVTNQSDKALELQKQLKLMRWSTGEEIKGDKDKIVYSEMSVNPGECKEITIDLSLAYDVEALEKQLEEKDHYYFVLTNNDFVFGQDWMCSVDFEEKDIDVELKYQGSETLIDGTISIGIDSSDQEPYVQPSYTAPLAYEDWTWPTVRESVTTKFGTPRGVSYTDHINIQGDKGDAVYAVADGTVLKTGFDSTYGYYTVLDLGEGITVKYGHLQDLNVENGETVEKGQKIATLGASGMATGPNLAFFVYEDGKPVNPLVIDDDV